MLRGFNPGNEALAIVAIAAIALSAMYMLGAEAKDIALSLGSGLVGYLTKSFVKSQ